MTSSSTIAPAAGDASGAPLDFEALLRRHQAMVYSLALHFLRDAARAEELAQEVFLELHAHLGEVRSAEHAAYWLRKVTGRRCIDQSRRHRLRAHVPLEDAPEPFTWLPGEDPALKRYIQQLLGRLAETPRMIVLLRYQEGLEPAEIAELLEMPVATVKSHLQRALAVLRRRMGPAWRETKP